MQPSSAIRAAMSREPTDIIVDEFRHPKTMRAAVQAAILDHTPASTIHA